MPGLKERKEKEEAGVADERKPGDEDAAGNKIHHHGLLGHITHWEHEAMNAEE